MAITFDLLDRFLWNAKRVRSNKCMIKIFRGAGVVTPSKPPPPYEQLLPLPTPCFKMFLERSLNDPPPPHFKHLSLLPPLLIHHPSPPKNFDHTPSMLAIRITLLIILRYKMHCQICKVVTLTTNSLNLDI